MRYLHFDHLSLDTQTQVLYRHGDKIQLEPKVYDLLLYFCRNADRVLSKDELMEQVWSGTLVTENAISRTLVKVRKALEDDPKTPNYIATVPRKGYRMLVLPQAAEQSSQPSVDVEPTSPPLNGAPNINSEPPSRRPLKLIAVIAPIILVLLAMALWYQPQPSSPQQLQSKMLTPLTRDNGQEYHPVISPDQRYLAYTEVADNQPPNQPALQHITIRDLTTNQVQQLTHPRGHISRAAWSPDGNTLAYLYRHNDVCYIRQIKLTDISDHQQSQVLTECNATYPAQFQFSPDGLSLYFSNKASEFQGYQIYRIELASLQQQVVNQPITQGRGNYSFDLSPDGQTLVMLNSEFAPRTRIYTLELDSSQLERTAQLDYLMRSVIWHHDSHSLIHPSPHPAYELWQSDISGEKMAVVASSPLRVKQLARHSNGQDYIFTSYLINSDLVYQPLIQNVADINMANSTVMDYLPALANHSNQYVFVSKRTGKAEVYLAEPGSQQLTQLTQFNNAIKLYGLHFSPDDSQLLIQADHQLYLMDVNSKVVTQIAIDNQGLQGVSWQDNKHLLLSVVQNNSWQLMRYEIQTQTLTSLDFDWQGGLYSQVDNHYYLFHLETDQLMRLASLDATPELLPLECGRAFINRQLNLHVTESGIYCQPPGAQGLTGITHHGGDALPALFVAGNEDLDINGRALIYARRPHQQADIIRTRSAQ